MTHGKQEMGRVTVYQNPSFQNSPFSKRYPPIKETAGLQRAFPSKRKHLLCKLTRRKIILELKLNLYFSEYAIQFI
jgi:hypothetical protein